jgi:hypothetical protein
VSGGVNSACAARRFACEAFAQEPIHHQLGLTLKLGWCGVHDCAGPPSLLARNPAENFGRDWWVVVVAVDRGAIRHDLFPKQSGLQRRPGSKDAIGWGYSQLDQRTLFLSTLSQRPRRDGASDLCEPRRCSLEWLDERLRRERLCEIGEASRLKRSLANGGVVFSSHVDDRHGNASSFEAMPQLDA